MTEPYYQDADVTLWHGECVTVMRGMDDNSVHAVVTDPPAAIGFMGREWDSDKGGREQWVKWFAEVMAEALRVTKPGGHAIVWALPRTAHWTACGLEDAGWIIRDRITHMFGSGFPKSLDVGKAIDRSRHERDDVLKATAWIAQHATAKALDRAAGTNGMGGHWTTQGAQAAVPTAEQWHLISPILPLPPSWLSVLLKPARTFGDAWQTREITQPESRPLVSGDTISFDRRGSTERERRDIPTTDAARTWQGWGTALKPAAEDWWVARKPLTGTVAQNVMRWGTGAINVDGCRVEGAPPSVPQPKFSRDMTAGFGASDGRNGDMSTAAGRWPSNVVLTHSASCTDRCVDGCPVRELDRQSGVSQSPSTPVTQGARASGSGWDLACNDTHDGKGVGYADTGGSSRFFPTFRYEAKAPTLERPKIGNGPTSASAANRCASCGRQDLSGSRCACPDPQWVPRSGSETATAHPTVKPLSLMRFLVRLVTPPDGTILDPFAGSGTTLEAAMLEGFNSIGIEQDPDYLPLIAERIRRGKAQGHQPDLFGGAA